MLPIIDLISKKYFEIRLTAIQGESNPASNYLLKVNNRNTRIRCEIR